MIGIFAGAICCVPLFFLLFLPPDANGVRSTATIVSEQFAIPAALQWKGVAELIAKGVTALPYSAVVSMVVAAVAAAAIEIARIVDQGPLPALGGVDRPGRGAAARSDVRDVGRRDDLLGDGPAHTSQGHARPRVLGRRHGADLRRADLRRGAGGHRQRDRQRAAELAAAV